MNTTWIENMSAGLAVVAVREKAGSEPQKRKLIITNITDTQVICGNHRFSKSTLRTIGTSGEGLEFLEPITMEFEALNTHAANQQKLRNLLSRLNQLSPSQVQAMINGYNSVP